MQGWLAGGLRGVQHGWQPAPRTPVCVPPAASSSPVAAVQPAAIGFISSMALLGSSLVVLPSSWLPAKLARWKQGWSGSAILPHDPVNSAV